MALIVIAVISFAAGYLFCDLRWSNDATRPARIRRRLESLGVPERHWPNKNPQFRGKNNA
jgi:hypothetical protein